MKCQIALLARLVASDSVLTGDKTIRKGQAVSPDIPLEKAHFFREEGNR